MAEDSSTVDSGTTSSSNITSSNVVSGTPNSLNTSTSIGPQGQGLGNQQVNNNAISSPSTSPVSPSASPSLKFAAAPVRNNKDLESSKAQFTKTMRMSVQSKELMQLSEKAMTGSVEKLDKVDYEKVADMKDNTIFQNNVKVETHVSKLKQHAIKFDMEDLFREFPILEDTEIDESDRFRSGKTINLIDKWDRIGGTKDITIDAIADTVVWIKKFATADSEIFLQDLDWSHQHIMNSLTNELREDIQGTLDHDYHARHIGGPLTFALMIDRCINLSDSSIEKLKEKISSFSFKEVTGEDVLTMTKRFKYALKRLESNDAMTDKVTKSLFTVFQTTSVDEFNKVFEAWELTCKRRGAKVPSYTEILDEAAHQFKDLQLENKWNGTDKKSQGSMFLNRETRDHDGPPPDWSDPKDSDKISSNPDRFERTIRSAPKKYCSKCKKYGKGKKLGRWGNHHTDEHRGPTHESDDATSASANLATNTPATPETRNVTSSLSFQQALLRNNGRSDASN